MKLRHRSCGGFTLIETMVAASILATISLIISPLAGSLVRRAEGFRAISTIQAALATARLQAITSGANVVVVIGLNPDNSIYLASFRDKASLTTSASNDGDGIREEGEPSLPPVDVDSHLCLWQYGGEKNDLAHAAPFDGYFIKGSLNAGLTNRIIFLPDGGIQLPQNSNSGTPAATTPYGRGIYFADTAGKNFFRVTVASGVWSGFRVHKYMAGHGYVAGNWAWQ